MRLSIAIFAVLTLALTGCASSRTHTTTNNDIALVAPRTLNGNHSATQVLHGAFGSREMSINAVITVNGEKLTVVGLTAMGVRVFTIHYDGQTLQVDNDLPVPVQLTAERLLVDVQLIFWPLDALRESYKQAGLELSQPFAGTRRVRRGDRVISEVHYAGNDAWNGRDWLVNLEHGYTLAIDSKPLDSAETR